MFLNDALRVFRRDVPIPRTLRIHDAYRTAAADPEALALRPITRPVGTGDVQLLHAALHVRPRTFALLQIDAVRPEANEEVTRQTSDAKRARRIFRRLIL